MAIREKTRKTSCKDAAVPLAGIDKWIWTPPHSLSHHLGNIGFIGFIVSYISIYDTLRLVHVTHSELNQTCLSSSVLSDNKGVKTFFRWYDELPYVLDKGFA
jgi:hypothetical protein